MTPCRPDGPSLREMATVSVSSPFLRCLKYAVYGVVCARVTLLLIRKYRSATSHSK